MVYLLERMDFFVMSVSKVELSGCRAKSIFRHSTDVPKAKLYQFHEIDSDEDNDDEELEEIDMFLESDVAKYTAKGNVGIICTGDDHNYYLAKLIADIHETGESGMDDNNREMPVLQKVIVCSYLQIMKI